MPYRICKRFEVESGHMLSRHPARCKFPHGHTRTIEVVLEAGTLDANNMVCDFKAIKEKLLSNLCNFGQPFVYLENANYKNRGELYLIHRYEGVPLKLDAAKETLGNLVKVWQRPVNLETVVDKRKKLLTHNGKKVEEKILK